MAEKHDDSFELYDLRVEVTAPEGGAIYCGAKAGDYFELRGEMLHLPPGQGFSIYSLAALLPLMPAKQRPTHPNDWMTSDAEVACPDPNCSTRFRIRRLGLRKFSHAATTAVPISRRDAPMQRIELSPGYEISRVIRGGWQLSGSHSATISDDPASDMIAFADAGITTFDCADIYTGVEELIGQFRSRYRDQRGEQALDRIKVHTKFVPDLDVLPRISKAYVEGVIDTSLRRLRVERLDLVQFHWWNYAVPRWLETAHWLDELRRAGKIDKIGGTNFDTRHMVEMIESGVPIASMQVQYSLLDRRPRKAMVAAALKHGVALFCYGTVAGGFLSEKWLDAPEPKGVMENRSLTKYRLIIEEFGGWELFQTLLRTLQEIAKSHDTDIATVASAAVLEWPGVAAVIVGARNRAHLPANLAVSDLALTAEDRARIDEVLADARELDGDVFGLERDTTGRHGSIMKYNLNKGAA